jgi:hypothetical protein
MKTSCRWQRIVTARSSVSDKILFWFYAENQPKRVRRFVTNWYRSLIRQMVLPGDEMETAHLRRACLLVVLTLASLWPCIHADFRLISYEGESHSSASTAARSSVSCVTFILCSAGHEMVGLLCRGVHSSASSAPHASSRTHTQTVFACFVGF